MARRGENIHKRKDGRWEARIQIVTENNQKKYKSIYGKTYKEAKKKMQDVYKNLSDEKENDTRMKKRSLEEICNEWLIVNQLKQKPSTQLKYSTIIKKHILPELGAVDIKNLDENTINSFLIQKQKKGNLNNKCALSASYVRTMGIILNAVIEYAESMEYRKPMKTKILRPLETKHDIPIMDCTTQVKLENALNFDGTETATGILLALNTGMRIGEICALRWDDIDFFSNVIHVRHTVCRIENKKEESIKTVLIIDSPKTKTSSRDIPINSKLLPVLKQSRELSKSDFVVSEKENFLSPRTFEYRFHQSLKKYNIPDTNFHALRHTFATRCIELGVDVKTLSEILGHANTSITLNTYVHSSMQLKKEQLEKLTLLGV